MTITGTTIKVEQRSPECRVVRQLASKFINDFKADTAPDYDIIRELCHRSLNDPNPIQAQNTTRALFHGIIEPLCDDFSEKGVQVCNQVLTHILDVVRQRADGDQLHQLLNQHGFKDSSGILQRYEKIKKPVTLSTDRRLLTKKIIILSRVTAGADIAITSVIVHRLRQSFPLARIVLIGPTHLVTLFPELDNIEVLPMIYKNDGGLFDKMTSWPTLHKLIQQETSGDKPDSVLLFDPDTRMTQLGLLPLVDDLSTYYFPSRSWQPRTGVPGNLSILTNQWLNIILEEAEESPPYLVLHNEGHGYNAFCQKLKSQGCNCVIMINFGVGNNHKKKIAGTFEERLLFALLHEPRTIVILDSGRGKEEGKQIEHLLQRAQQQGINTDFLDEEQITRANIKFNNGLLAFNGSLDALGKMICASDCFIGYDSSGQHLAAATGTSAIILFAGAPSQRFIEHWSPDSNKIRTITINSQRANTSEGRKELITKIKKIINRIKMHPEPLPKQ